MPLTSGVRLGPYEVVSPLGAGGMGEVYRARDTKLGRDVALKVLPASLASDADRLARFRREAQLLAALNHPHIAQIYGVEDSGDHHALVMELVDGPTLDDILYGTAEDATVRRRLAVHEALAIAAQIVDALEAAHEQGIVHRDLKPGNIKVRPDGTVKVLDFGLAKATDPATASGVSIANSPTLTARATELGVILGTAAYMAPEQARGKSVDKRADIWAFGVVVYEMLTGRRAFAGEEASDVLAAVLRQDIEWSALPADTPPAVRRLLTRCLERDPKRRLRDIGDARADIEEAGRPATPSPETPARGKSRERLAWAMSMTLAVVAIGAIAVALRGNPGSESSPVAVQFTVAADGPRPGAAPEIAISPDGRTLAFVAFDGQSDRRTQLWIRPLDAGEAHALPGTDGATQPFWSPDSRFIGFVAQGKLKKIDAAGGPPQTLIDVPAFGGGTWNRDGVLLLASAGRLQRLDPGASAATEAIPVEKDHRPGAPRFLPDGRHFLYSVTTRPGPQGATSHRVGSLDSKDSRALLTGVSAPALYSASGHLLFVREGTLLAQPFDVDRFQLTSEATTVATGFELPQIADVSVSETGTLVYRSVGARVVKFVWFDRTGTKLSEEGVEGLMQAPNLSRDGKRVVYEASDAAGRSDLWVLDLARGTNMRLTSDGESSRPFFSGDGSQVVFAKNDRSFYLKSAGGTGTDTRLEEGEPTDWSADGNHILFIRGGDLWDLPLTGDRKAIALVTGKGNDRRGRFSPGGEWFAYESDESGRFEVYVQRFPPTKDRWQVSASGGHSAWWRSDGKELFFNASNEKIMSVDVKKAATFEASPPRVVLQVPGLTNNGRFVASLDGQRFLLPLVTQGGEVPPVTVVLNWTARLKRSP